MTSLGGMWDVSMTVAQTRSRSPRGSNILSKVVRVRRRSRCDSSVGLPRQAWRWPLVKADSRAASVVEMGRCGPQQLPESHSTTTPTQVAQLGREGAQLRVAGDGEQHFIQPRQARRKTGS